MNTLTLSLCRSTFSKRSAKTFLFLLFALGGSLISTPFGGIARADESAIPGSKPLLHPLFSENAVLQRDRPLPIWGWTQPQAKVVVDLDGEQQTAVAGDDGRWTVTLEPHAAGGPHSLSVTGEGKEESVKRKNLLFGDVWLCSGQSNMAYDLNGALNPAAERAAANYPDIRVLKVPNAITATPLSSFENGGWEICTPQSVGTNFTAVGYFFGRKLHDELKVPIGLIDSSWSGTAGQAWVSGPALSAMPDFKPAIDAMKENAAAQSSGADPMLAWWQNDPGTVAHQEATNFDDADWSTMDLPGFWEAKGFSNFDGVMWFRRTVDVPAEWAGRDLILSLGMIGDSDTTYWNGVAIGSTEGRGKTRDYTVAGAQVTTGNNVIAVRVLNPSGDGGFSGPALSMKSGSDTVSLDDAWKIHQGPSIKNLPPLASKLDNPSAPTVLFNGKISPLVPGQIKGVIWYQGESNADTMAQAEQYRTLLPILINDWRTHFGEETPFYIAQLANFKAHDDVPSDDPWPHLREAQLLASQHLPHTGLCVFIDLGEEKNVHFPNKQEAGSRMALSALANTYGVAVESSGPTLKEAKAVEGAMELTFDHADGLNLKGDENRVFSVAGADMKFQWATPQIEGDKVTIRSNDVPTPVYARFGWSNNPRASLFNAAGLPASPFRVPPAETK